jgi:release factor glutamine methyltransferase
MSHTLVSAWKAARERLEAAGVPQPVIDARLLVEAGAGVQRIDIITDPHRSLSDAQVAKIDALVARRETREPVAHILGYKDFWSLRFAVSRAVLTPRPESETVVEAALAALPAERPARVLDLGVGSGALLCAILSERPLAKGIGVDLSDEALAIATHNLATHNLSGRAEIRSGAWGESLDGPFDLIVSNPPYIETAAIDLLEPEVSRFEPRLALDGGDDGLDAYRALLPDILRLLSPNGFFVLELGYDQGPAVSALVRTSGLTPLAIRPDILGIGRALTGRR